MGINDYVIRPIQLKDLPSILEIAKEVGSGFTSLPNDTKFLERKVERAVQSFQAKIPLEGRSYLFVMEELTHHKIIGTAAIEVNTAFPWPSYQWKLFKHLYGSNRFHERHMHVLMVLANDLTESTELGTLYLNPLFRGEKRGEILSRMRGLFIAEFNNYFHKTVIAEIRGQSDETGYSPFYESVIKPFLNIEFVNADYKRALEGKQFVSDLLPRYPIYLDFLTQQAKNAIGNMQDKSKPAYHVLSKEGFIFRDFIDIFDGGPVMEVSKSELKTVKYSRVYPVAGKITSGLDVLSGSTISSSSTTSANNNHSRFNAILSNSEISEEDFRCVASEIIINEEGVLLEACTIDTLKLKKGSLLRVCPVDYQLMGNVFNGKL